MRHAGRIVGGAAVLSLSIVAVLWAALALHFAPLVPPPGGDGLAALMLLGTVVAFGRWPAIKACLVALIAPLLLVFLAFLQLSPTNDRPAGDRGRGPGHCRTRWRHSGCLQYSQLPMDLGDGGNHRLLRRHFRPERRARRGSGDVVLGRRHHRPRVCQFCVC